MARALGGDHAHVHLRAGVDLAEVDREPVGEQQEVAGRDAVADLLSQIWPCFSSGSSTITTSPRLAASATRLDPQAVDFGLGGRVGALAQADHDLHAGVLQVERVGVALRAVAEHRNGLAVELREVRVLVVDHRGETPSRLLSASRVRSKLSGRVARQLRPRARSPSGPCAGQALAAPARAARRGHRGARANHERRHRLAPLRVGHARPPPRRPRPGCACSTASTSRRRHVLPARHDQVLRCGPRRAGARRRRCAPRSPVCSQPSAPARPPPPSGRGPASRRRPRSRSSTPASGAAAARSGRPRTCDAVSVIP